MWKRILSGICITGFIIYSSLGVFAIDPTIYKGNYTVYYGVVISSMGLTTNGSALTANASVVPIISSFTYVNKSDWLIEVDAGGFDVWISSFNTFSTSRLDNVRKRVGTTLSPEGKITDTSIFGRTLAGTANLTTVYITICGRDNK